MPKRVANSLIRTVPSNTQSPTKFFDNYASLTFPSDEPCPSMSDIYIHHPPYYQTALLHQFDTQILKMATFSTTPYSYYSSDNPQTPYSSQFTKYIQPSTFLTTVKLPQDPVYSDPIFNLSTSSILQYTPVKTVLRAIILY